MVSIEFCCLFRDTENGIPLSTTSDYADLHQIDSLFIKYAWVLLEPKLHLKSSPRSRKFLPQTCTTVSPSFGPYMGAMPLITTYS